MTHVLIAVDDSESSVRAATTAHRLFGDDAHYTVLNVAPGTSLMWGDESLPAGTPYPLYPGAGVIGGVPLALHAAPSPDDAAEHRLDEAQRRADEVAREAGLVDARVVGDTGDAADAILVAACDHHVDVIVVGTHERNWFSRLFSGSVSDTVAKHADVPVLIAR